MLPFRLGPGEVGNCLRVRVGPAEGAVLLEVVPKTGVSGDDVFRYHFASE